MKNIYLHFKQLRRKIAAVLFIIPLFFWFYAVSGASNAAFFTDQFDVQMMVVSGSVSMVIGAIAALWE
jgi:hypothetical protein